MSGPQQIPIHPGQPGLRDGGGLSPKYHEGYGMLLCVSCDFLTTSCVQQKQDGLPVESHVSGHQSCLMGRQYSSNPCFISAWRIQCLFHHIDPHHTAELPHTHARPLHNPALPQSASKSLSHRLPGRFMSLGSKLNIHVT